jgi:monoamine oxidase
MVPEYDVVVVGAGLAGLRAAQLLQGASKRVLVLEARDRVGGRTLSVPFAGDRAIDLGAQWIGPKQRRVVALAGSLRLTMIEQSDHGASAWKIGAQSGRARGLAPQLPVLQLLRMLNATARMEWRARRVPKQAPWQAARAAEWDAMSVADFLQRHAGNGIGHAMLDASMRVLFAAEPRDISLLHALFYIHAGAGLQNIMSVRGGAQHWWLVEGAGTLAPRLARELNVQLSEPVRAISAGSAQLEVASERGRYLCRRVIVALPPVLTQAIAFDPALPAQRQQLSQGTPMGAVTKCFVQYAKPFWRDAGLSGEAFSDGVAGLVMDGSHPERGEGLLIAFLLGDRAREYAGRLEERKRAVIAALAELFGDQALSPTEYRDHDWCSEAYSRGCYSGIFGPGILSSCGAALREPVGRIHWAGTETAVEHEGYMEGALESAERAASEVIKLLD